MENICCGINIHELPTKIKIITELVIYRAGIKRGADIVFNVSLTINSLKRYLVAKLPKNGLSIQKEHGVETYFSLDRWRRFYRLHQLLDILLDNTNESVVVVDKLTYAEI